MTTLDFTLKNEGVKSYFEGSDSYVPASELWYLHTHPLIRPNFLTEIETLIDDTAAYMVMKNMRGSIVERFTGLTVQLGQGLPVESEEDCHKILPILRQIYKLCRTLMKR